LPRQETSALGVRSSTSSPASCGRPRAHRLDHADAADVVQATFVRLVEHLGRLQQPDQVGAWLATTARRECLLVLRQRKRVVPPGDALPEPVDDRPEHGSALVTEELAPHDPDAAVDGT
jgi:DNA-directed RNA polymerase specialized sigma24 family protein